ncbi:uncharacterized protein LOC119661202 [Hermetia illucens]|uniref:uncharacterized protein LOC119661202 n=1 Tax=Hermetia illucens TaxID=343691 RepID=UPI0018CC013E|nr:uncharacterized protein LOC119661202 [Hermetia illucens]
MEGIALTLELIGAYNNFLATSGKTTFAKINTKKLTFLTNSTIFIEEIMNRVSYHYQIDQQIKGKLKCIDALWDQLKFFQRCLQSKNEQDSVDGLVMLIDATYEELITEGSGLEELRKIKYNAASKLNCPITLIRFLISHVNAKEKMRSTLLAAFANPIEDWSKMSWEETSAPSFKRLYKLSLLERGTPSSQENINGPFQYDLFEKHMRSIIEYIYHITMN